MKKIKIYSGKVTTKKKSQKDFVTITKEQNEKWLEFLNKSIDEACFNVTKPFEMIVKYFLENSNCDICSRCLYTLTDKREMLVCWEKQKNGNDGCLKGMFLYFAGVVFLNNENKETTFNDFIKTLGYRKVDENDVVLPISEYEDLKDMADKYIKCLQMKEEDYKRK